MVVVQGIPKLKLWIEWQFWVTDWIIFRSAKEHKHNTYLDDVWKVWPCSIHFYSHGTILHTVMVLSTTFSSHHYTFYRKSLFKGLVLRLSSSIPPLAMTVLVFFFLLNCNARILLIRWDSSCTVHMLSNYSFLLTTKSMFEKLSGFTATLHQDSSLKSKILMSTLWNSTVNGL